MAPVDGGDTDPEDSHPNGPAEPHETVPVIRPALVDNLLKLSIAIAVLCAGASVGYYFAIYLPAKDARARSDAAAAASAQAADAAITAAAQDKRRADYQTCLQAAQDDYSAHWDSDCATHSAINARGYTACLSNGMNHDECASLWPTLPTTDCSLPLNLANSLNAGLKDAQARCLDEAKAGL